MREPTNTTLSIDELLAVHTKHLTWKELRPSTIYQRQRSVLRLAKQVAPLDVRELTEDQVRDALDARGWSANSKKCELAHLGDFYHWAVRLGFCAEDPVAEIDRPRGVRRLPRPMPDADVIKAFELVPDLRVETVLTLAAYAGLRAYEIAAARGEDVLWDPPTPTLLVPDGKGGKPGTVPLNPFLTELLERLPSRGVLVTRRDGLHGPNKAWTVCQIANQYLHGIGIDHTLHSLRHWFGTKLYAASGYDLLATQQGLRHRWSSSTEGYVHITPHRVAQGVVLIPSPADLAASRDEEARRDQGALFAPDGRDDGDWDGWAA